MIFCHSHQRRSQFAWKNQKIGSKAATSGVAMLCPHDGWPASWACQIPVMCIPHWNFVMASAMVSGIAFCETCSAIVCASKRLVVYPAGYCGAKISMGEVYDANGGWKRSLEAAP